ncbi:MAG: cupin domain-containing protein [Gammaproteobacteria bacterium]|nr:MAG: cupin domain-containing protein [Gammaproteobacteria bacterium]
MSNPSAVLIPAKEGQSFWQPGVRGNCITIKISPWNIDKTNHTVFLHELPKTGEVPEHAHEIETEIFICLEGEGILTLDGKEMSFRQHDVAYVPPLCKHRIQAISDTLLKFMVIISPIGLEERLKLMGQAKSSNKEIPPDNFSSPLSQENTHGVIR